MNETTIVLPSARAIRERLLDSNDAVFLPNFLTMSDFISRLCIVEGFCGINEDGRVLLLLEASDFKNFAKLQIERNFFTFTKNSSYIFKFFQELSAELYDINNLSNYDVYGEYEEHIKILQELYGRYEELCKERKIADTIFLPKLYTFNVQYVKSLGNIEIFLDGYLTNLRLVALALKCVKNLPS
jgi:inactivated superfamily I helicase